MCVRTAEPRRKILRSWGGLELIQSGSDRKGVNMVIVHTISRSCACALLNSFSRYFD